MGKHSTKSSQTADNEHLARLISEVMSCLASAENALAGADHKRIIAESGRLERMLRGWHSLEGRSIEHDVRLQFTEGVQFFASTSKNPFEGAALLRARIATVSPVRARKINIEKTTEAIASYRNTKRMSWKVLGEAWGGVVDLATWRKEWSRHRNGRGDQKK